jgi:pilus assembly protein CpaC
MEGDLLIVGRLFRFKDWQDLAEFAQSNSFNFQMQAELPMELQAEAQSYFHQRFSSAKVPPQTLIFSPNIEIRANCTEIAFKKYLKILAPFGVQIVRDEGSLEVAPTIKVQITVAEVKKDFNLKYGLKWPASYSATVMTDGQTSGEDLPFNATALEIQGFGKILASPNLVCRSGKEAEFLAGGEFPIKVMNFKMADVQWKRYGILLRSSS